jgi:nucleoredoxin
MRRLLVILCLIGTTRAIYPAAMPLTTHEISLMLRSGYSSDSIIHELSVRHFADAFDDAAEKQLTQAGASAALVNALRKGSFQASPAEIAAANEKIAARQDQAAAGAERAQTGLQKPAGYATEGKLRAGSATPSNAGNSVYEFLKGDLVWRHQNSTVHFDDEGLEQKKYFLFFFSANWSPVGRKFTSQLVDYYNRVSPQHPELEIIFFSADHSQFGMETYLGQSNMPWPAIAFDKVGVKTAQMQADQIKEIPALILIDSNGRVLSNGYGQGKESGPEKVLADLDKILAGGSVTPPTP